MRNDLNRTPRIWIGQNREDRLGRGDRASKAQQGGGPGARWGGMCHWRLGHLVFGGRGGRGRGGIVQERGRGQTGGLHSSSSRSRRARRPRSAEWETELPGTWCSSLSSGSQ